VYQIRNDLQKSLQQQDETNTQTMVKLEQRINSIRVDLNLLEEQMNQRLTHVSIETKKTIFKRVTCFLCCRNNLSM